MMLHRHFEAQKKTEVPCKAKDGMKVAEGEDIVPTEAVPEEPEEKEPEVKEPARRGRKRRADAE